MENLESEGNFDEKMEEVVDEKTEEISDEKTKEVLDETTKEVLDEEQIYEEQKEEVEEEKGEDEINSTTVVDHQKLLESVRAQIDFLSKENQLLQHFWEHTEKCCCAVDQESARDVTPMTCVVCLTHGSATPESISITKTSKSILIQPELDMLMKCYLAKKRLEDLHAQEEILLKRKNAELDKLKAKIDETEIERTEIAEEMKEFNEKVRRGARHHVTKKVMAEKVENYFNASLKREVVANERLKINTCDCRAMRKKIMERIKLKEEALETLQNLDIRKAKDEYSESVDLRKKYEQQYFDYRARLNRLLQDCSDLKKAVDKEQAELTVLHNQVKRKERSRIVFDHELTVINKEKKDCKELKESIERDSRCARLPAVMDYVYLQSELVQLKKAIRTWRSKVETAEAARSAWARGRS